MDDTDTVQALLDLDHGLGVSTCRTEAEIFTIMNRLMTCGDSIAPIIVRYASRMIPRQDVVLARLLLILPACGLQFPYRLNFVPLIRILVEAGAALTHSCFLLDFHDQNTLEELVGLGTKDLLMWIEEGLLTAAIRSRPSMSMSYSYRQGSGLLNWILSSLERSYHQKLAHNRWTDHDATTVCCALVDAFQFALDNHWTQIIEAIYDTGYQLTCFVYYSQSDFNLNSTVMQACSDRDWLRACRIISESKSGGVGLSIPGFGPSHVDIWRGYQRELRDAIVAEDFDEPEDLLNEDDDVWEALDVATSNNCDEAAALLATYCCTEGIFNLLAEGKVQAISILLCKHSHWSHMIHTLGQVSAFEELEDILCCKERHKNCRQFPCCLSLPRLETHQIVLRVLSYHALYKTDTDFLDWLLDHDFVPEGVIVVQNDNMECLGLCTFATQTSKLLKPKKTDDYDRLPPSLLEIAAGRNDETMLSYLLSRRLAPRDSDVLLEAVRAKAHIATIEILVQAGDHGDTIVSRQYGSGALRLAIREKNHDLLNLLARVTDIHGLEAVIDA